MANFSPSTKFRASKVCLQVEGRVCRTNLKPILKAPKSLRNLATSIPVPSKKESGHRRLPRNPLSSEAASGVARRTSNVGWTSFVHHLLKG